MISSLLCALLPAAWTNSTPLDSAYLTALSTTSFFGTESLSKTHIDNLSTIINRVDNGICHILVTLIPIGYRPYHHDFNVIRNSIHPNSIVPVGSNNASDMGAMEGKIAHHIIIAINLSGMGLVSIIAYHFPGIKILIVAVVKGGRKIFISPFSICSPIQAVVERSQHDIASQT